MRVATLGGAAMLTLAVLVAPAGAQTTLERVDRYAHQGLTEAARALLIDWWDRELEAAPEGALKHALWLRGVLTVDPLEATQDFERLADEFGGGALAEDAVVRLARIGIVLNEPERTEWAYRLLLADYPESEFLGEARAWMEQAPALSPVAAEPTESTERAEPTESAGPDPAADAGATERTEPFLRAPLAAARDASGRASQGAPYTVQVGAFAQTGPAAALAVTLRDEGFEARLVQLPGSSLILVRVGRFDERAEASVARDRLLQASHEAIVQEDATRERPVG